MRLGERRAPGLVAVADAGVESAVERSRPPSRPPVGGAPSINSRVRENCSRDESGPSAPPTVGARSPHRCFRGTPHVLRSSGAPHTSWDQRVTVDRCGGGGCDGEKQVVGGGLRRGIAVTSGAVRPWGAALAL